MYVKNFKRLENWTVLDTWFYVKTFSLSNKFNLILYVEPQRIRKQLFFI